MTECSCVYVYDDGDPARFRRETLPVARVEHRCDECGGPIVPRERYERVVADWGEGMVTLKTCPSCLEIRTAFFCESFYHGMIWEDLRSHLREIDGNVDSECLANLSPAARAKVCDEIQEIWDELNENEEERDESAHARRMT